MPKYASNMNPANHDDLRQIIYTRPMLFIILLAKDHDSLDFFAAYGIMLFFFVVNEVPTSLAYERLNVFAI